MKTQLAQPLQTRIKAPIWCVVSVDNGKAPAATPAKAANKGIIEWHTELRLTFVPDQTKVQYIYYTLCTYGPRKEMITLARCRSRIAKLPKMGAEFKLPMMMCNQNSEGASLYLSIVIENASCDRPSPMPAPVQPPPLAMEKNPYDNAPESPYNDMPPYAAGIFSPQMPVYQPPPSMNYQPQPQMHYQPPPQMHYQRPPQMHYQPPPAVSQYEDSSYADLTGSLSNPYANLQTPAPGAISPDAANLAAASAW